MRRLALAMGVLAVLAMVVGGCSREKPSGPAKGEAGKTETAPAGSGGGQTATPAKQPAKEPGGESGAAAAGEVRVGMTQDEVTKILGEPTTQTGMTVDGKDVLQCAWEKGGTTYLVHFQDGKAAWVQQGTEGGAASAEQVKANFSKVKIGMGEAEVVKLLGPPTNSGGTAAGGEMSFVVKTWEVGDNTYTVTFMNGKVQMTHKE
jgi:outer membrane protein assembly factor BamE (lipoprotein component of BamABCDE complex)